MQLTTKYDVFFVYDKTHDMNDIINDLCTKMQKQKAISTFNIHSNIINIGAPTPNTAYMLIKCTRKYLATTKNRTVIVLTFGFANFRIVLFASSVMFKHHRFNYVSTTIKRTIKIKLYGHELRIKRTHKIKNAHQNNLQSVVVNIFRCRLLNI